MLILPHVAVGAVIGAKIDNTLVVIIFSIVSHYILDMLPHYDSGVRHGNRKNFQTDIWDWILVVGDFLLALIFVWWAFVVTGHNFNVIWGALATFLIDFLDKIFFVRFRSIFKVEFDFNRQVPIISSLNKFHKKIHYQLSPRFWYWGIVSQIAIIIIGGWLCLSKL